MVYRARAGKRGKKELPPEARNPIEFSIDRQGVEDMLKRAQNFLEYGSKRPKENDDFVLLHMQLDT